MNEFDQKRFDTLYRKHLRAMKLQCTVTIPSMPTLVRCGTLPVNATVDEFAWPSLLT